ncbi:MAG: hypothetical protein EB101_01955 [Chitinophagia bacterium]|nr:hypothetical protein [Chitinophagia bacterium]
MTVLFDQVSALMRETATPTFTNSRGGCYPKERWSAPLLISIDTAIIRQEEDVIYRELLGMSDDEFRLLSGSGR